MQRRVISSDGGLPYVDPLFLDVPARSTSGSQQCAKSPPSKLGSDVTISGNVLSGVIAQQLGQQGDADKQELELQRANYRMSVIMEARRRPRITTCPDTRSVSTRAGTQTATRARALSHWRRPGQVQHCVRCGRLAIQRGGGGGGGRGSNQPG